VKQLNISAVTETKSLQVLLITYYWPPSGGSGVQRWLKFVKYLPEYGITPIVFTPENPEFDLKDNALLKDVSPETEVLHFPIWEPYRLFKRIKGLFSFGKSASGWRSEKKVGGVANWIRGNFFIPDPRIFWVAPSIRFLNEFIKSRNIQVVITTGPPHSMHLIGLRLKQKNQQLKWIADFRDPWTDWGALKEFRISSPVMQIHHYLEKKVLNGADEIITISPFYVKKFQKLTTKPVRLFTNGYDASDFQAFKIIQTKKFILRHVGVVHPACDVIPFLKALKDWVDEKSIIDHVEIIFTGIVNARLKNWIQGDDLLNRIVQFENPVDHDQLMDRYARSSALLLILTGYQDAEGFLPGKMFEYIATGLPVIGTGPVPGDAQSVLTQARAGSLFSADDTTGIKNALSSLFADWKAGNRAIKYEGVQTYDRKQIAATLSDFLKSL
jgi:glycosyltransferase involved in cell wall biosynthesis